MKKALVMAATVALMGCGGAAKVGGGKAGAAQALQAASAPTKAGVDKLSAGLDVAGGGVVSWTCPHGGKAELKDFKVSVDGTAGAGTVAQTFNVTYLRCGLAKSEAGVALYDGTFQVSQRVEGNANGGTVEQTFKGRVALEGAFNDFLEADVKQRVAISSLGSGSVAVRLEGSLTTSGGTHRYAEEVKLEGDLPVEVSSTR